MQLDCSPGTVRRLENMAAASSGSSSRRSRMMSGWATAIPPSAMLGAGGMEKCSGCSFRVICSQDTPVTRKKISGHASVLVLLLRAYADGWAREYVRETVRQPWNRHNKKVEISNRQSRVCAYCGL